MSKWYAIPPYGKTECWKIHNERGELIATFEDRDECERAVKLVNALNTQSGEKGNHDFSYPIIKS